MTIKYEYAFTALYKIVCITEITKENRNAYFYCPSCGQELRPRLGNKRVHHFYHKKVTSINECGLETYLHRVAKNILFESLNDLKLRKQPYYLYLYNMVIIKDSSGKTIKKDKGEAYSSYDILECCDEIYLEKQYGEYKPDILLEYSNKETLFLEINVCHKSTLKKITNNAVVDIVVSNESDISRIQTCLDEHIDEIYNLDQYRDISYLVNSDFSNTYRDKKSIIDSLYYRFKSGVLICSIEYEQISDNENRRRKMYTKINLRDFYAEAEVYTLGISYFEMKSKNGDQRLLIGFDQRIKEIAPTQKYIILKDSEYNKENILHYDNVKETNMKLDLSKLDNRFILDVSCFIPKGYHITTNIQIDSGSLKQKIEENSIELFSIEQIRRV